MFIGLVWTVSVYLKLIMDMIESLYYRLGGNCPAHKIDTPDRVWYFENGVRKHHLFGAMIKKNPELV